MRLTGMTLSALFVLTLSVPAFSFPYPPVQVEEDVDQARYAGLWYEVARNPNPFELGCTCTTAYYEAIDGDSISVFNACNNLWAGGFLRAIEGVGTLPDPEVTAKLEVRFFDGQAAADYWILDVVDDPQDPDGPYRFAVVGDPNRLSLFILSRTPRPTSIADRTALAGILERLRAQSYPTIFLVPSRHPIFCDYEDHVP